MTKTKPIEDFYTYASEDGEKLVYDDQSGEFVTYTEPSNLEQDNV